MDTQSSQTIASFTGTLLRKEKGSNNLVQLVFREKGENVLCISSNPVAEKLPIGRKYRVEGALRQLGKKPVIQEPRIQLLKRKKGKAKIIIGIVIATVLLACIGVAIFALKVMSMPEPAASPKATATQETTPTHTLGAFDTSDDETNTTPTADASQDTSTTASTPKPTTRTSTTTPAVTTPVTTPATTQPEQPVETPSTEEPEETPPPQEQGVVPQDGASTEQ